MVPLWILFTLLAVAAQTVRTAGQKQLSLTLDSVTVTFARYLYGAPFVFAYYAWLWNANAVHPGPGPEFWLWCILAAIAQILATILMVQLFHRRNFAVGITYIRSEAFLTAFIGSLFFGEVIGVQAWAAILTSVVGVLVLTRARSEGVSGGLLSFLMTPSAIIGLSSGLLFALTSLAIRSAGLSLQMDNLVFSGATTLMAVVTLQTAGMGLWFVIRRRDAIRALLRQARLGTFVGLTSAIGSTGWFTAMTLERASYVKALGQIELILAMAVSILFFKEKINRLEFFGVVLTGAGIIVLLLE